MVLLLWMIEEHFLDFDAFDRVEFGGQLVGGFFVVGHFEQDQAVGGAEPLLGFVKSQSCSDAASVFSQEVLDRIDMLDSVGNVNTQDNVFFQRHIRVLSFL
jgi:hypothetical protein